MPWIEPLADPDELRLSIRRLVALSTLSAAWRNYDMRQIGDGLVAALVGAGRRFRFLGAPRPDHVMNGPAAIRSSPANLDHVRAFLRREKGALSSELEFVVANGGRNLHVATAPIESGAMQSLPRALLAVHYQPEQKSCCSTPEQIKRPSPSSNG